MNTSQPISRLTVVSPTPRRSVPYRKCACRVVGLAMPAEMVLIKRLFAPPRTDTIGTFQNVLVVAADDPIPHDRQSEDTFSIRPTQNLRGAGDTFGRLRLALFALLCSSFHFLSIAYKAQRLQKPKWFVALKNRHPFATCCNVVQILYPEMRVFYRHRRSVHSP